MAERKDPNVGCLFNFPNASLQSQQTLSGNYSNFGGLLDSVLLLSQGVSPKCMLPTHLEEEPVFVNARQYERILKRRLARNRQQMKRKAEEPKQKKKYMHESRHNHACKRQRGPKGTFVSAEKKAAQEKDKKKVKYSRYSAACVLYGMPPDD